MKMERALWAGGLQKTWEFGRISIFKKRDMLERGRVTMSGAGHAHSIDKKLKLINLFLTRPGVPC